MKNQKVLILLISLTCFAFQIEPPKDNLGEKVDSFLSSISTNFDESPDRYSHSEYNDIILEKKVVSEWSKTITLKSKTSFKNHYGQTVYQRLYLGFHEYESENVCDSAFSTLMNCLGNDCAKVKWGEELNGIKSSPFLYIKTDDEIVFCKINCEHENDFWTDLKSKLINTFSQPKSRIIETGCGGPLNFRELN